MRIFEIIQEARKNPQLNPKTSINHALNERLHKSYNTYISFTVIDKLGINPRSPYNTPLGIYAYPGEYVMNFIGPINSMWDLPFAGNSPFANIFSAKGNVVELTRLSNDDLNNYYQKIIQICPNNLKKSIEDIINNSSEKARIRNINGGKFWYVTMKISKLLANIPEWGTSNNSISWNKLFRSIGINGCTDAGRGIIHPSEPSQAVFFSINAIKDNERYYNKYAPIVMHYKKEYGQEMAAQKKLANDILRDTINSQNQNEFNKRYSRDPDLISYIKLSIVPKDWLIDFFQQHPETVNNIERLPQYLQKMLIDQDLTNARYINNLSNSLQLDLVKKDPTNIQYINDANETTQLIALKNNAFNYINRPLPQIQILAVRKDPINIQYVINPSQEIVAILNQQPENIQAEIISKNYRYIQYIKNPSVLVQCAAVRTNPKENFKYVDLSLEEVQLELINNDIRNIKFFGDARNIPISDRVTLLIQSKLKEVSNDELFIANNPYLLNFLPEERQIKYISLSFRYIYYLREFSENIIKILINKHPLEFFKDFLIFQNLSPELRNDINNKIKKVISNLSASDQSKLIDVYPQAVDFIKEPSIDDKVEKIVRDIEYNQELYPRNVTRITVNSIPVQLALLEKNPMYILNILNPENETQIEAIKKLYKNMLRLKEWIRNPTDEAKELWTKLTKRKYF